MDSYSRSYRQETIMSRRLAFFAVASLLTVVPRLVAADASIQATFDTVDAVEIKNQDACDECSMFNALVIVTGIVSGNGTSSKLSFTFGSNVDMATRCEHLAIIAMSKPGKYQFAIGSNNTTNGSIGGHGDCRLTLVTQ
jgi:hypothetical protein